MPKQGKETLDDYQIIKVLGKGCMGKVLLVRHKKSSNLYALKSISKSSVIVHKELNHTLAERRILSEIAQIHHPFLIQCHHAFTSENELFLVLDFVSGGDLATQLAKFGKFPISRVRVYAAEIVLGLIELHRMGIVYRDLKPENILLQPDGHIILTDFGLSKMFLDSSHRTSTFAGTADYLAPEILRNEEYSYEVDWWSFGTLVYEMIAGMTPFWAENHSVMYQRVLEDKLEFSTEMPLEARSIIEKLLERVPTRRLGYGVNGGEEIKRHAFFKGINWHDVALKRLDVPYIPIIRSKADLSNFEECFTSMSPRLSPATHDLSSSLQQYFQGYSWAPTGPAGSVSRSILASIASSICDSNLANNSKLCKDASSDNFAARAAETYSYDMDVDNDQTDNFKHPPNSHYNDDIDLDLTPSPDMDHFNSSLQLSFSRVKKPPNNQSQGVAPNYTRNDGNFCSLAQSNAPSKNFSSSSLPSTPTSSTVPTANFRPTSTSPCPFDANKNVVYWSGIGSSYWQS